MFFCGANEGHRFAVLHGEAVQVPYINQNLVR